MQKLKLSKHLILKAILSPRVLGHFQTLYKAPKICPFVPLFHFPLNYISLVIPFMIYSEVLVKAQCPLPQ